VLKKLCPKCNKVIDIASKHCDDCKEKYGKRNHKAYDTQRKDDKYHAFYKTREWVRTRTVVLGKYNHIDLYELHINHRIVAANTAHHIIEIRVDWDRRLDISNLFPCSHRTHNKIENMYKRDREGTQMLLRKLLQKGLGG